MSKDTGWPVQYTKDSEHLTNGHVKELEAELAEILPKYFYPVQWGNSIMEKAQEFASAWSLVGGRFDDGTALVQAEQIKSELRALVSTQPQSAPLVRLTDEEIEKLVYPHYNSTESFVAGINFDLKIAKAVMDAMQKKNGGAA